MSDVETSDDASKLAEISRELPPVDVDEARAKRMAALTRQQLGHGPSPKRLVEPILVGIVAISMLVWLIYKLIEILT
jgi:hypothetical protein